MATNSKIKTPAASLNYDKAVTNKMYVQPPKQSIKPVSRNPITQEDVEVPTNSKKINPLANSAFPSAEVKNQGIRMGEVAQKSKNSRIFEVPEADNKPSRRYIPHSASEVYIPTVSLKKSVYAPANRNPITQDEIPLNDTKVRTKISESSVFAHLGEEQFVENKPRNNI